MNKTGRPLRFLGYVVCGWIAVRLAMTLGPGIGAMENAPLAMSQDAPALLPAQPALPAQIPAYDFPAVEGRLSATSRRPTQTGTMRQPPKGAAPLSPSASSTPHDSGSSFAGSGILASTSGVSAGAANPAAQPEAQAPAQAAAGPAPLSRWSLSGWLLWRRAAAPSLAQGPLLGGSQGGVRLDYRLWQSGNRSFGLYGRYTRALERPFADEAAVGLALRPVEGLPFSLMAERRQRLNAGGRSDFALLVAGGIDPAALAPRVEAEGYAQAGIVGLPHPDAFADGQLSVAYRLTPDGARHDLALGVNISAGAQQGASRLDIGPQLRLRLPVAGGHVRLSAEWRQRISGNARPASGPAIALVTDF